MDLEKTVKIIFSGQDKDLANTATNIAGKFDTLNSAADKIHAPLAKASDTVMKVDAALAALAVGGLILAVRESANFNQGFGLISTSVDATGQDLENFRGKILDYSKTSVKGIDDINAAIYTAAQAGIKYGDSLEFIGKAEQLAVANKANLNTTVDLLTGTMNAYGYKVSDVGHLNDVFFQSTLIGKQTIDSLGASMGQVVGIAANFGVSFEQLSGAIATLTAKGMETSEAITAVKSVITTFVSPSKEAADAAAALGLNFSASSLKGRGFSGMLSDVMAATGGSADQMAKLFSEVRALNGVMQLTGDGMKFFNDAMVQINGSAGASEAAYKKMVVTFENQSQMLINSAKATLIDVGTRLEPVAAGISGALAQVLGGIDAGIKAGAFDPLFKMLDEAGNELKVWLAGVAKALPDALKGLDFSKLLDAFNGLGEAFSAYFGDMDLTKVEDLHEFIQKIIDGIAGLIRVTEGMVEGFRPFFEGIKNFLISIASSDEETKRMIGTIISLGKVVQEAGLAVAAALVAMDQYGGVVKGVINIVAGGVQILWNFAQQIYYLDKAATAALTGNLSEVPEIFQKMRENGDDAFRGVEKIANGFGQLAGESDKTGAAVKKVSTELKNVPAETNAKVDVNVKTTTDQQSLDAAHKTVKDKFSPGQTMQITTNLDGTSTIEAVGKMNAAFPKEKKVEVKPDITQTAIAELKEKSSIVQKSIEWKAKIDIAQIESATKIMEAAFKSVDSTVVDTGKTMTSLAGTYATLIETGKGGSRFLEQMIEDENKRRDAALKMQEELVEAQVKNLEARTEAMRGGQAMIQIDGQGLQPHLEAFMFEILSAIQIRANAEGAQYLVGI